jgi:hypothetical protein
MRVGFHAEGHDHLILKALLAKTLGTTESTIFSDHLDEPMGWHQVLEMLPKAIKRFYGTCCAMAVIAVDNDGNEDLIVSGAQEDAAHPRHWLHRAPLSTCRHCQIASAVASTRPHLHWLTNKPGESWPVVVCVPVEMIETWLLIALAVTGNPRGSHHAERERRANHKQRVYGRPEATRDDVESIAVPLIRSLTSAQLDQLRASSRSFDAFCKQIAAIQPSELTTPCW